LPHLLFYIDLDPNEIISEVSYQLGHLNFNPGNLKQSNLNKSLASYSNNKLGTYSDKKKYITPILEELNLPFPAVFFGYSVLNNYHMIDTTFFSKSETEKVLKLIGEPQIKNALKRTKSRKILISTFSNNVMDLAKTNQNAIKEYYPEAKLLYMDIGLVGDATQYKNWNKNIPLELTNELKSIWETDIILGNGSVKFREGNNWNFNWGGDDFPIDICVSYGQNINVEPGKYHVIFNLSEKTYQFIKHDE